LGVLILSSRFVLIVDILFISGKIREGFRGRDFSEVEISKFFLVHIGLGKSGDVRALFEESLGDRGEVLVFSEVLSD